MIYVVKYYIGSGASVKGYSSYLRGDIAWYVKHVRFVCASVRR